MKRKRSQWFVAWLGLLALAMPMQAIQAQSLAPKLPIVGRPRQVIIPALGINAKVEILDVDRRGVLQVPRSAWTVGWYQRIWPGENGQALMYGHLNTATSARAVFTQLHRLRVGDEVKIVDERRTVRTFRVTKKAIYPFSQTPISELTGASSSSHLNLFTCAGWWSSRVHNYSHRLVVYTDLVSTSFGQTTVFASSN